jgi:hypothetical protein
MTRLSRILRAVVIVVGVLVGVAATAQSPTVSFHKDVEPILQKNCQTCHRPGQVAPMSFMTYENARPYARAMKAAVLSRKMPPWFADPQYGPYLNDRSLSQHDIDTLVSWVDAGAPEGAANDGPPPAQWPQGWFIKPDIIVDGPVTDVPARTKNNVVEWSTVIMPSGLTKDTWVTSVQIKPEFPEVTHHLCIGYVPHNPQYKYGVAYWADKERDSDGSALPDKGPTFLGGGTARSSDDDPTPVTIQNGARVPPPGGAEDCYLPGNFAADYRPLNAARLIPAGSDITFGLHYTPNGKAVTDHVKVGFTVADRAPERRYLSFLTTSPTDPKRFAIPPNTPNWESPPAEVTFLQDAELVYLMPHMHARGKDMTYSLEFPDGRKQVVLSVPRYDFNWQLGYNVSIKVPKGTKLHVDAHFDNSASNRSNPDPNKTVYYGTMTWEEMMNPFYSVVVPAGVDPRSVVRSKYQQVGGGG